MTDNIPAETPIESLTISEALARIESDWTTFRNVRVELVGYLEVFPYFCVLSEEKDSPARVFLPTDWIWRHLMSGAVSVGWGDSVGGRLRPGWPDFRGPAAVTGEVSRKGSDSTLQHLFPLVLYPHRLRSTVPGKEWTLEVTKPLVRTVEAEVLERNDMFDTVRLAGDSLPRLLLRPDWLNVQYDTLVEILDAEATHPNELVKGRAEALKRYFEAMVEPYLKALERYGIHNPYEKWLDHLKRYDTPPPQN